MLKVFHAARQDIEIFLLSLRRRCRSRCSTPRWRRWWPGSATRSGYDALVAALTGGQIDKAHRFSDWSARPLSAAQIAYAAADVTHLRGVYERLRARLERDGRLDWVGEEMAVLADPATYRPDPETMWERLRPRSGNRRMLGVLRAIAAWREREAQRVNIPRQRVLRDEALLEIAATAPRDAGGAGAGARRLARASPRAAAGPGCSRRWRRRSLCPRRRCRRPGAGGTARGPRRRWWRC